MYSKPGAGEQEWHADGRHAAASPSHAGWDEVREIHVVEIRRSFQARYNWNDGQQWQQGQQWNGGQQWHQDQHWHQGQQWAWAWI